MLTRLPSTVIALSKIGKTYLCWEIFFMIFNFFILYIACSPFKWLLSFTRKCMNKWQETASAKNAIVSKQIKFFCLKILYNFKTSYQFVSIFKIRMFWTDWELTSSKNVTAGSDRAGQGWFITDVDYMVKKEKFCSINSCESFYTFGNITLFESLTWLWEKALDCELALSRLQIYP